MSGLSGGLGGPSGGGFGPGLGLDSAGAAERTSWRRPSLLGRRTATGLAISPKKDR